MDLKMYITWKFNITISSFRRTSFREMAKGELNYRRGEYLAVLGDDDGFWLCRTAQHVYTTTGEFNINWLEKAWYELIQACFSCILKYLVLFTLGFKCTWTFMSRWPLKVFVISPVWSSVGKIFGQNLIQWELEKHKLECFSWMNMSKSSCWFLTDLFLKIQNIEFQFWWQILLGWLGKSSSSNKIPNRN